LPHQNEKRRLSFSGGAAVEVVLTISQVLPEAHSRKPICHPELAKGLMTAERLSFLQLVLA
jgi:hypothetical protein